MERRGCSFGFLQFQPTLGIFAVKSGFSGGGGRKPLKLPREHAFRKAIEGKDYASYANVPDLIGVIVSKGLATLHELDTVYGYEDALNLYEIIKVQNYNDWIAMEASKNGRKRN